MSPWKKYVLAATVALGVGTAVTVGAVTFCPCRSGACPLAHIR